MKKPYVFLAVVMLISCIILCGCSSLENSKEYKQADKLFKQGEYMEAAEIYFDLHAVFNYKDSEEKYKMCYYEFGKQLVEEEDWFLASTQFNWITDYKDARNYVAMCEAKFKHELLFTELKPYELLMSDLELLSWDNVYLGESNVGELYATSADFKSEEFATFTDNDKLTVLEVIGDGALLGTACTITSGDSVYTYANIERENYLYKDGKEILVRLIIDSPTYKTFTSGDSCPVCNGSGSVRYNYGSSDLEALLTGNDAFTVGSCTSCDGKGKFYTTTKRTDVPKTDAQKIKEGTYNIEEPTREEIVQELIDGFGNEHGNWNVGSALEFEENRESYEFLDSTAIQNLIIGEWTQKSILADTIKVIINDDFTTVYYADGFQMYSSYGIDENRFIKDIENMNITYEVRKAADNLLIFYNLENHPVFIFYK